MNRTKLVFRNKMDENSKSLRNRARLFLKGYNQQEIIDLDETCAQMANLEFVYILFSFSYIVDFKLFQMDVKSVFLNRHVKEEVYVNQTLSFKI